MIPGNTWIGVGSTNVAGVKYEEEQQKLHVRFTNGMVYIYRGVPSDEVENLVHASSPGTYLRVNIIGTYPHERG